MPQPTIPSLVLHHIFNNNLFCQDQLFFANLFFDQLNINDQCLLMILRHARQIDLQQFCDAMFLNDSQYILIDRQLLSSNSTYSWPTMLERSFDVLTFNRVWGYFSTNLFHLYTRLFSFSPFFYRPQYPLVDVFQIPYVLESREVNAYEYQLFEKLGNGIIQQPLLVTTINQFVMNLNNRFHYQHWSIHIDFNKFRLAGGSVLLCMLRFFDQAITSDLDFFYVGEDLDDFLDALNVVERHLKKRFLVRRTTLASHRVYQLQVTLVATIGDLLSNVNSSPSITMQFIFHPQFFFIQNYLMAFDFDVVQLCFDGDKVLCTWAAIQALSTGTFICYCLSGDIAKLGKTAVRIAKYIARGFTFLYPHDFPMKRLFSLPASSCNIPSVPSFKKIVFCCTIVSFLLIALSTFVPNASFFVL